MSVPSCKDCRYWWKRPELASFDLCRRFPKYEPKSDTDWCGEFQAVQTQSSPVDTREIAEYLARRFGVPPVQPEAPAKL